MTPLSRRHFIQTSTIATLGMPLLRAIEPFPRSGNARLRLALAAYCFRDYFVHCTHPQSAPENERTLTMEKFIDQCGAWGVRGAELTSYYFPKNATPEYFAAIRRHAHLAGVTITGTSVSNVFTHPPGEIRDQQVAHVKHWIDNAATMGAPHVRIFAGDRQKGTTLEEAKKFCISQIEECADYAGKYGIFLGIENHHGIVAEVADILEIVRAVKSKWVGINLDTGNFKTDDPYASLAKCAPYAVNVQIKTEIQFRNAAKKQPAELAQFIHILREAAYQGWMAIELEEAADPWKRVPQLITQFHTLLSDHGHPAKNPDWLPLFNGKALGAWKPTDFAGKAEIEIKDGQMILNAGGDLNGVHLEKPPAKIDYEVQFDAMRIEGDDFFVGFTFPVSESHATFIAGGWSGSVTGISSINGDSAMENETTQFIKYENKKWVHFRLSISKTSIQVWMDGKRIIHLSTKDKQLAMRAGEIEISKPFGFATWRTKAALKNIQWRPLQAEK